MAEDGSAQSATTWPVPEFHFSVEISEVGKISCKEVSGLDMEFDVIEYRSGDMPGFTKIKMPYRQYVQEVLYPIGISLAVSFLPLLFFSLSEEDTFGHMVLYVCLFVIYIALCIYFLGLHKTERNIIFGFARKIYRSLTRK